MKGIRRRPLMALPAAALLVLLAVAGCGSNAAVPPGTQEVVLEDYRFTPNRIDAKVGTPVTIRLTNRGTQEHDLNFQSLHMEGLQGVEAILAPGESRTVTVTFRDAGTHTFICTLPGHAAAGMTGAAYIAP